MKTYLLYLVGECEMGSEGYSTIIFPCIVQQEGEMDTGKLVSEYIKNVFKTYDASIANDYSVGPTGCVFFNYMPLFATQIKTSIYGHIRGISVETDYDAHPDGPSGCFLYQPEQVIVKER